MLCIYCEICESVRRTVIGSASKLRMTDDKYVREIANANGICLYREKNSTSVENLVEIRGFSVGKQEPTTQPRKIPRSLDRADSSTKQTETGRSHQRRMFDRSVGKVPFQESSVFGLGPSILITEMYSFVYLKWASSTRDRCVICSVFERMAAHASGRRPFTDPSGVRLRDWFRAKPKRVPHPEVWRLPLRTLVRI